MKKRYTERSAKEELEKFLLSDIDMPNIDIEWDMFNNNQLKKRKIPLYWIYSLVLVLFSTFFYVKYDVKIKKYTIENHQLSQSENIDTHVKSNYTDSFRSSDTLSLLIKQVKNESSEGRRFDEYFNSDNSNLLILKYNSFKFNFDTSTLTLKPEKPVIEKKSRISIAVELVLKSGIGSLKDKYKLNYEAGINTRKNIKNLSISFGLNYNYYNIDKLSEIAKQSILDSTRMIYHIDSIVTKNEFTSGLIIPLGITYRFNKNLSCELAYRQPLFNTITQHLEKFTKQRLGFIPNSTDSIQNYSSSKSKLKNNGISIMISLKYTLNKISLGIEYVHSLNNEHIPSNLYRINLGIALFETKGKSKNNFKINSK